ncbi:Mak10-domain-containing protein [Xylariaceae sp. FL1651]|nr:Mak10-domain-containing protein [Xylariaceae sp. FL1651]
MQPFEPPVPPPPNLSHPGIMAIDITDKFASAVKTLAPGELVKDEHFTLFESVSALEIMDPKMDSGVLEEGESLDEEYDVTRGLLPEEILGIIDQLLCLEMAWHLGYPLSQTLLTSVYVEALMNPRPTTIEEVNFTRVPQDPIMKSSLLFVLRSYCAGLLKACCLVNELMKEELYYEEEDFVTNTYDRSLLYDIPTSDVTSLLQKARTELQAMSNNFPLDICAALGYRLDLRMAFLDAIDLSATRNADSESTKIPWTQMRGLIDHIEDQHALGSPVPEAFSIKLQRRLASTMPPRPMVKLSFEECISHFKQFFQNGIEVTDVLEYRDPQSLVNFVLMFQAQKPQPHVFIRTILQNLLFKDMVVLDHYSIRQLLDHDVSIAVLPYGPHLDRSFDDIEVPTDPRHQIASQMELFRQRVADVYLDLFRILCQNRCRVRRTLCHHIQEWDILEADVGEIEERLQAPLREEALRLGHGTETTYLPLTSWVYLYKLRQMEWIVQLGFELRVYQHDELAGMYHYLKRLASLRAQHTEHVKQATALREEQARNRLKLPKEEPLPPDPAHEYGRARQHLRATMLDAACTWEFADGLCLLYVALARLGLGLGPASRPPSRRRLPYGTDELRYELRMRPFARVAYPQLPAYDELEHQTALPDTGTPDLLRFAEAAVGAARKGFEAAARLGQEEAFAVNAAAHARWVSNAKDCLRATIAAGVAVSTLKRAYERATTTEDGKDTEERGITADRLRLKVEIPEPGDGYHDWWIVPKITPLR